MCIGGKIVKCACTINRHLRVEKLTQVWPHQKLTCFGQVALNSEIKICNLSLVSGATLHYQIDVDIK